MPPSGKQRALLLLAGLGWFGLGAQLYLVLAGRWQEQASLLGGLMSFFSYFTVLSNTWIAAVLTAACSPRAGGMARWFRRPAVQGGGLASIALVALTYTLLLRNLWAPQGWQWLANEILHDVMPLAYLAYWLAWVPKGSLRWTHPPVWALYLVVYFGCTLLRGNALGVYPYPFINVLKLGYAQVWVNALGVLAAFLVLATLVVLADHRLARRAASAPR